MLVVVAVEAQVGTATGNRELGDDSEWFASSRTNTLKFIHHVTYLQSEVAGS